MADNSFEKLDVFSYALSKSLETFQNTLKEYEKDSKAPLKLLYEESISIDNIVDKLSLPMEYKFAAKIFKKFIRKFSWEYTVDIISDFLKDYGKDKDGKYKSTGEVLDKILNDFLKNNLKKFL